MFCYFIFALLLAIFGAICYTQATSLNDYEFRYDDICLDESGEMREFCFVNFTVPTTLTNPKIYYKLENFYANHRNFVKSRSYSQLRGNVFEVDGLGACDPVPSMGDLLEDQQGYAIDGVTMLSSSDAAHPCGLIAKYHFNDRFRLETDSG